MTALPENIAARPYWHFAVRPNTPVQVYPQRYLEAAQPPEGPRQWFCDLAVLSATPDANRRPQIQKLADCRVPFLPLTKIEGHCCALTLGPAEVAGRGGLQAVLDLLGNGGSLSLLPGKYPLSTPLVLTGKHAGITLQGCGRGVLLGAEAADLSPFVLGLILVEAADSVTLRQLEFFLPGVPESAGDVQFAAMFGVTAAAATTNLTVRDCTFH